MERIPSLLDSLMLIGVSIPHKIDPLWRHRFLGEVPPQVLHVHLEQTRLETELTLGDREELMKRMLMYNQADLSEEKFHVIDSFSMFTTIGDKGNNTTEFSEIPIRGKNITDEDVKALVDDWGPDPTEKDTGPHQKKEPAYRKLERRGRQSKFQPWRKR